MEDQAFQNVENQMGRCGIWCGSCVVGNGTLKTMTSRCEHIIRGYGVDEWGAKDFDGKELMKGLASIQTIPICKGCLKGGGNEVCKIRPCVIGSKLSDCTECNEMGRCENHVALVNVRTGALKVGMNIRMKEDKAGQLELMERWSKEIKERCEVCSA
jgi:hypothetical protein